MYCLSRGLLAFIFVLQIYFFSANSASTDQIYGKLKLGKTNTGVVSLSGLRNINNDLFLHADELLVAVDQHKYVFEVEGKSETELDANRLNSLPENVALGEMDGYSITTTTITYVLDSPHVARYFNLDSMSDIDRSPLGHKATATIMEISNHYLVDCSIGSSLETGSFVIGSSHGSWSRQPHVQDFLESRGSNNLINDPMNTNKKGLLLARRVLGVKRGFQNSTCAHVTTEDVHPWELFSSISIQARGVSPFQHTYQHRSGVPETNPPVSEEVRSPRFRQHDVGTATNSYEQPPKRCNSLQGDGTCTVRVNGSMAGFLFNTDDSKAAVMQNIHLGGVFFKNQTTKQTEIRYESSMAGVICVKCFAFIGAGFELTVNYTRDSGFESEMFVTGETGYNIDMEFRNAVLSGNYYYHLVSSQPDNQWVATDVGVIAGLPPNVLTLNHKFGGLSIEVGGYGNTTGVLTATSGRVLYDTFSVADNTASFDDVMMQQPQQRKGSSNATFRNRLATGNISATVVMTATEQFKLVLNLASVPDDSVVDTPLEFRFDAYVAGHLTVSTQLHPTDGGKVTVFLPAKRKVAVPGDRLTVLFEYSGLAVNSSATLFYSVSIGGGVEYPILTENFILTSTGSGAHKALWIIPWDINLAGDGKGNAVMIVRSSADIVRSYVSSPFGLAAFTETDGMFMTPKAGDVVPLDTPYQFQWVADMLTTHELNFYGAYGGRLRRIKDVKFTLAAETVANGGVTGTVLVDLSPYVVNGTTGSNLINVGVVTVKLPPSLGSVGDRFYIWVQSTKYDHIRGWSSGYFSFVSQPESVHHSLSTVAATGKGTRSGVSMPMSAAPAAPQTSFVKRYHPTLLSADPAQNFELGTAILFGGISRLKSAPSFHIDHNVHSNFKACREENHASQRRLESFGDDADSFTTPRISTPLTVATAWLSLLAYQGTKDGLATVRYLPPNDVYTRNDNGADQDIRSLSGLGDFTVQQTAYFEAQDIFGFIGYSANIKAIYIVFRGTISASNWNVNLNSQDTRSQDQVQLFKVCPDSARCHSEFQALGCTCCTPQVCLWGVCTPEICVSCPCWVSVCNWADCFVANGFYNAYTSNGLVTGSSVRNDLKAALNDLKQRYPSFQTIVTGHSLGASLATLCAADLIFNGVSAVQLINYESPRVFGNVAASYVSKLIPSIKRFTHHIDIVPQLPVAIYHHVVGEIYIDDFGIWHFCTGRDSIYCSLGAVLQRYCAPVIVGLGALILTGPVGVAAIFVLLQGAVSVVLGLLFAGIETGLLYHNIGTYFSWANAANLYVNLPTPVPTSAPTWAPSPYPTSRRPSRQPTSQPSRQPTRQPTRRPPRKPSAQASQQPTGQPTRQPTKQPNSRPSSQPSRLTKYTWPPTRSPTKVPTSSPSKAPTPAPTKKPSPTLAPKR